MLYGQVMNEYHASSLSEFAIEREAVKLFFVHFPTFLFGAADVFRGDTNDGKFSFVCHGAQVHLIVAVAIIFWILVGRTTEVHNYGSICKASAFGKR